MPSPFLTDEMRAKARERSRRQRGAGTRYNYSGLFRGKGCGPGVNARCPVCERLLATCDFDTDVITGELIEPCTCWRCAA